MTNKLKGLELHMFVNANPGTHMSDIGVQELS